MTQTDFHHATPVYEYLPGWQEEIGAARTHDDLPANAQAYVRFVEDMVGVRVSVIGVGPDRDDSVVVHDLL